MRTKFRIVFLLAGCLSLPLLSSAQSADSSQVVSVRELRIPGKARHAFEQGVNLLAKQNATASLTYFQQAIEEYAGYYEAYYAQGEADLKLWRIWDAEQAFRKSIELSASQYAHPLLALSAILVDQKKFTEAADLARKGLDLDPTSWSGHYYLGAALIGLDRMDEAEENINEALREKTNFPAAVRLLISIHAQEKKYDALLKDVDAYLKLDPDSPTGIRVRSLRASVERLLRESEDTTALAQPVP
jgi:tetratricopeptide (TPR) repeat protein